MSLSILADAVSGQIIGKDAVFTGVSTDTRTLSAGDLFIPLKGPRFDGHNFIAEAINAGAAGAILGRSIATPLPYVLVADTHQALGQLATFWRKQFDIPVIAITGSNGKTTVKEMVASIMREVGPGCVTQGNLNNDIGVPQTLLTMRHDHRFAAIEMGMNHRGEIDYLSRITKPTVAVITNAAEAHLEGLGSVAAVAEAKGEIFRGLKRNGIAIINADDEYAVLWRDLAKSYRCLSFGLDKQADVTAHYTVGREANHIHLITVEGEIDMRLPLIGRHNVMNALAASSAALSAGATLPQIQSGLEKLKAVSGRLEVKEGISGARVIDDTYNANPASVAAGLQVLKEHQGERVLILGDMAELGEAAEDIHRRTGELAKKIGIHRLLTLGKLSRLATKGFGKGAKHYKDPQQLIENLQDCMHADMSILIKGSRKMKMEQIVNGILRKQTKAEVR